METKFWIALSCFIFSLLLVFGGAGLVDSYHHQHEAMSIMMIVVGCVTGLISLIGGAIYVAENL